MASSVAPVKAPITPADVSLVRGLLIVVEQLKSPEKVTFGSGVEMKIDSTTTSRSFSLNHTYARLCANYATLGAVKVVKQDKLYLAFLAISCAGFSSLAAREFVTLGSRDRRTATTAIRECATMLDIQKVDKKSKDCAKDENAAKDATKENKKVVRKKKTAGGEPVGADFWKELSYLIKVAMPTPYGRFSQLLAAQFALLVMRTLLTVRANKVNTFYLTKAISSASWKFWVRWVFNFGGWMGSAVVVNTGLRYTETLIQIELRNALTRHAHKRYMAANNFYRTAVLREGGLDNVDQRIVADIDAFSKEAAFLYGHSFKPILEFTLSLAEAAKELGYSRPLALFAAQIFITSVLRQLSPSLGKMVAKEQALEGGFRHTHARLIAHAEEVALLGGATREVEILDEGLKNLVVTQRWHALQRIRKSIADNVSKFQGLLVGGVFVHVPFLVRATLSEGERISLFRATEELMLRCGSAFTEVLLLGRNLDELAGYTYRLGQLFHTMDKGLEESKAKATEESKEKQQRLHGVNDIEGAMSDGRDSISFNGVSVGAPEPSGGYRLLVKRVSMAVTRGSHLLITGPNGCGKTSLLRVLAGLWAPMEGSVRVPSPDDYPHGKVMMWLPQRPYLLQGSLRDQVVYPNRAAADGEAGARGANRTDGITAAVRAARAEEEDEKIKECLRAAGLGKFVDGEIPCMGLSTRHLEWNDVLSGGERQRIGFARLLYHNPPFAILDEATSAINPDEEHLLYERVIAQGTTVVSIAHRLELRRFHKRELKLKGDGTGGWELLGQTGPKGREKWSVINSSDALCMDDIANAIE